MAAATTSEGRVRRSPQIRVRRDVSPPVMALLGDVDIGNYDELHTSFAALADEPEVVIDLSEASFIDSTVIGALIKAKRSGLQLTMTGAHGAVMRTLILAGVTDVIRLEPAPSDSPMHLGSGVDKRALEALDEARQRLIEVEQALRKLYEDSIGEAPLVTARLNVAARLTHRAAGILSQDFDL